MRDLTVTLIQDATVWHDAGANQALYGASVRAAPRSDLIVLPETFLSGFSNAADAETMDGQGIEWLRALSAEVDAVITGSLVVRDQDLVVNRLVWARPDGTLAIYDKRHLFRMAKEHERYVAGAERLIVDLHGWRICPQVCYDLRFPVWLRNRMGDGRMDYDALLFVANWPSPRHHHWRTLLQARAIENLAYCVAVNRVGTDGNQLQYLGGSAAIDFLGNHIAELGSDPGSVTVTLSAAKLAAHRERFPAWMDADEFELK